MPSLSQPIRSYSCFIEGREEYASTINAPTAGKAKYAYLLDISDCYHNLKITDICSRSLGGISEPKGFRDVLKQRGIEFARIGMRVCVDGRMGSIVGHNHSANLNVLFDGDSSSRNCHPWWSIAYFDEAGNCLRAYDADGVNGPASPAKVEVGK